MVYLEKEAIQELWGDKFSEFADNKRVKFTSDKIFVELKSPVVTLEESETKIVTINEPTIADLRNIDNAKGDVSKAAYLLSACAGIPMASVNKIKGSDFILLTTIISVFLA
jgi:hypothetical protein